MNLLTLDTSQGITSLALWKGGKYVADQHYDLKGTQATKLIPQIESIMVEAVLGFEELDGIACTTGPGGFTSVRIGVATARGIGFAANIPVWGVSMLEIMAWYAYHHASAQGVLTSIIPAGNRDVCVQQFTHTGGITVASSPFKMISRESLLLDAPYCMCEESQLQGSIAFPTQKTAYYLGEYVLNGQDRTRFLAPVPLYAKPADAIAAAPLLKSHHF